MTDCRRSADAEHLVRAASQQSCTESMSAMSAIEQPAARFGRITAWSGPERMSAVSAMKCTPQKTMTSALRRSAASWRAGRNRPRVGVLDDFVALVEVAQDHQPLAECWPSRRRSGHPVLLEPWRRIRAARHLQVGHGLPRRPQSLGKQVVVAIFVVAGRRRRPARLPPASS